MQEGRLGELRGGRRGSDGISRGATRSRCMRQQADCHSKRCAEKLVHAVPSPALSHYCKGSPVPVRP